MKYLFLFILSISLARSVQAQQKSSKINFKDSVTLSKTWEIFKNALFSHNQLVIRNLSLRTVDCDQCQPIDIENYNPFISINIFLKEFFPKSIKSGLWQVMKNENYHATIVFSKGKYPPKIKRNKDGSYSIFWIIYNTVKPNKNWEGRQDAFEFVRINGQLKFFGLSSIP